jgi:two-component system response regulator AtoC
VRDGKILPLCGTGCGKRMVGEGLGLDQRCVTCCTETCYIASVSQQSALFVVRQLHLMLWNWTPALASCCIEAHSTTCWLGYMSNPTSTIELLADSDFVVGHGKAMETLNTTLLDIARTDIPVLILGESGTGKEVYARILHRLSSQAEAPLKRLNCSILDPNHVLQRIQDGLPADSGTHTAGTLFLDGIDELDLPCQRALLSVLPETQGHRRIGSVFMRIISSSVRNLESDIEEGRFRKELYFRINGVCLRLPPLRERKEDIVALLQHFLRKHAEDTGKVVPGLDQETLDALIGYDWPGNIRELENLARNMVALGNTPLAASTVRDKWSARISTPCPDRNLSLKTAAKAASREKERELILEALERTKWNRKRAARELQISYKALLYKLKQIGTSGTGTQN